MSGDDLRAWWPIILFGVQAGFGWTIWSLKKGFVAAADHRALTERVQTVEQRLDLLPHAAAVNEILVGLEALRGDVKVVQDRTERLERGVERLESHHLAKP